MLTARDALLVACARPPFVGSSCCRSRPFNPFEHVAPPARGVALFRIRESSSLCMFHLFTKMRLASFTRPRSTPSPVGPWLEAACRVGGWPNSYGLFPAGDRLTASSTAQACATSVGVFASSTAQACATSNRGPLAPQSISQTLHGRARHLRILRLCPCTDI